MREPNPVLTALANGDIDAVLAEHRKTFGDMVMTSPPPPAAPPAPPAPVAPPAPPAPAFDPRTGDPNLMAPAATDPSGVWAGGVVPAAAPQVVPPPTQGAVPPAPPAPGQPYIEIGGVRYFNTDFVEQARREERDKMHGRLETIEQEMVRQRQEREAELEAERAKAAQEAAEAEAARLATLSPDDRIVEIQNRLDSTVQQFQETLARRDAFDQQERRFNDLVAYRQRRLAEEQALIHPTLIDLVAGPENGAASEQQIEESITAIKAKTDAIVGTLKRDQIAQRQAMPGVAPTGAPPSAGPLDQTSGYQSVTSADIAAMDPATYAKNRPALMAAMQQSIQERGLYGG